MEKSVLPEPKVHKSARFMVAYLSLCVSSFVSALDACIVAVAIPTIAHEFDASSNEAFWIGTAFLLSSTITQPLFGSISQVSGWAFFNGAN